MSSPVLATCEVARYVTTPTSVIGPTTFNQLPSAMDSIYYYNTPKDGVDLQADDLLYLATTSRKLQRWLGIGISLVAKQT